MRTRAGVGLVAALLSALRECDAFRRGSEAEATTRRLSVPYTMFTLPNGLTVILHEDHGLPLVSVNVWYHVGSGREKPGRTDLRTSLST